MRRLRFNAPSADSRFERNVLRACAIFLLFCLLLSFISCSAPESTATKSGNGSGATGKSGGSAAGTKAPDVDACSLVSRADAEAIMGKLKEAPKPVTSVADEKTCSYMNMNGANVTVRIYGSDWYDVQKNLNDAEKIVSLAGLGDEAYYVKKSGAVDLWSRKDSASLYLNGTIGLEQMKRLATKILSRL
jgi:hypothetical protein